MAFSEEQEAQILEMMGKMGEYLSKQGEKQEEKKEPEKKDEGQCLGIHPMLFIA